ncbi:DUF6286 domain-containing protein [Rathayibacter tanaceti]|uniref:Uncharacterized protein n=2 Tax=Rathayibacter tanaceti TaxID=1671680 RepID=A0A162IZY6_9MICO|nr:DUF6286 domain-containing protein [Rathayibacter tanaceti]KZX20217.1 hypothetical protein ACH61_02670 [Rathayibacter tanaceti]QHC56800.1 hypothetical protein GSU10_14965 [Rathayibacter tanaceti]TCO33777.1 hypothetical protein EV639_11460 [Rathayibacter tanaceti]
MTTPSTAGRALYPRLVRRETHSSRSGSAIVLAVLLILLFAWLGTEAVLAVLAQPALLVAPQDGASALLTAASAPIALTAAAGAVLALIGLALVVVSFAPGRRGRRAVGIDRTAAVVDDRVIAQAVARTASHAGDIDPDQVSVSVGARTVGVTVSRTSGRSTDVGSIREAVDAELATYDCTPRLRSRVRLSEKGTVR